MTKISDFCERTVVQYLAQSHRTCIGLIVGTHDDAALAVQRIAFMLGIQHPMGQPYFVTPGGQELRAFKPLASTLGFMFDLVVVDIADTPIDAQSVRIWLRQVLSTRVGTNGHWIISHDSTRFL